MSQRVGLIAAVVLAICLGAVSLSPASLAAASVEEHHIGVRVVDGNGELFDRRTGERFVVRGANYVFRETATGSRLPEIFPAAGYDAARVRRDFTDLAAHGYNTVRVFIDHCTRQDETCIGVVDGEGLNQIYLANVADLIRAAAEAGIYVLLTSNDLPDHGGYSQQANEVAGPEFAGYRNAFYLTPQAVDATQRYWRDIITGLQSFDAPTQHVLGWELLNEQWMFADQPPLSLTTGVVTTTTGSYDMADPDQQRAMVADGIVHYVAAVRSEILEHDPSALVTMGFFMPDAAPGWYTDPVDALARSDLDFLDFHGYPGGPGIEQVAEAFAIADHPVRPVVLGEYGAFRHAYADIESAALGITAWQARSCQLGFDGWLYWTYLAADPSVDDATWGLTDMDGYLLELLSPATHPDACEEIPMARANQAIGARVRASSVFDGQRPQHVIDEDVETAWSAGGHPEQWLQLDLAEPAILAEVQLLVSQDPAGRTDHVIEARLRGHKGFRTVGHLRGNTSDGDWLVFRPERPLRGVKALRVRTIASPSWVAWREIRLFEQEPLPGDS